MYSFGVTDPYPKEYAHGFFDNDERLGLFGTEPYDDGKWHFFGEKWLIQLHDGGFSELFMYDELGTKLREITELLRKEYEQFPHLSVIAVTETSNDAESFNDLTLELIDRMSGRIGFYRLGCNMDISAAKVSYEFMSR